MTGETFAYCLFLYKYCLEKANLGKGFKFKKTFSEYLLDHQY